MTAGGSSDGVHSHVTETGRIRAFGRIPHLWSLETLENSRPVEPQCAGERRPCPTRVTAPRAALNICICTLQTAKCSSSCSTTPYCTEYGGMENKNTQVATVQHTFRPQDFVAGSSFCPLSSHLRADSESQGLCNPGSCHSHNLSHINGCLEVWQNGRPTSLASFPDLVEFFLAFVSRYISEPKSQMATWYLPKGICTQRVTILILDLLAYCTLGPE